MDTHWTVAVEIPVETIYAHVFSRWDAKRRAKEELFLFERLENRNFAIKATAIGGFWGANRQEWTKTGVEWQIEISGCFKLCWVASHVQVLRGPPYWKNGGIGFFFFGQSSKSFWSVSRVQEKSKCLEVSWWDMQPRSVLVGWIVSLQMRNGVLTIWLSNSENLASL